MATFAFASVPTALTLAEMAPASPPVPGSATPPSPSRLGGSMQFSIQNTDQRFARVGRLSVQPGPGAQAAWLSFQEAPPTSPGQLELEFEKGATRTVTLQVAVPPGAPAGSYVFTLQIASENDPDNDFAQSPAVSFAVPERKPVAGPPPARFPWWAVAAGVALVLVAGGGAWWAFSGDDMVMVPSVAGKNVATAVKELNDASLEAVVNMVPAPNTPATVIATNPKEGSSVPKNGRIDVTVAIPPNAPDPCARRELASVVALFCQKRPIRLNTLQNPATLNRAMEAITERPR